jgi:ATP-dependent Clp protease ATP-binding subunit ClpC
MFERYTERARRVLFFSRYEASQFGSLSIETEHVLLGLVREGKGIVRRVFDRAHVSLVDIRPEVERRVRHAEKISTSIEIPFSAETKRVLQFAAEEADRLEHDYIGTEHLLLGLLREEKSLAGSILAARGLRLDDVRSSIATLLASWPQMADARHERTAGTTRHLVVVKTELKEQDLNEIAAQIDGLKPLVEQLGRTPAESSDARALVLRIHEDLDALKRRLGL